MDIPIELANLSVERGTILFTKFENIDHPKFFVIIGVNKNLIAGFFYVNSEINRNVNRKPEQLKMQYEISCDDYKFLEYDSYICATEIQFINKNLLSEGIKSGNVKIKDTLKPEHLSELLELARNSKLFSPVEKKEFLY